MPRPPLPLGTWGRISRTAILRDKFTRPDGTTGYRDISLVKQGNQYFLPSETERQTAIKPDAFVARCRFRDFDGVTRKAEAWGTTGAAAERSLTAQLADRAAPSTDNLNSESTLSAVWEIYRLQLIADGKADRTIDRYDYVALKIKAGLGNVRVREATTQRLDVFIVNLNQHHGPSVAKTARVVLSGMFKVAARFGACTGNPIREVTTISTKPKRKARSLTVDELQAIRRAVYTSRAPLPPLPGTTRGPRISVSGYCRQADLADVITFFTATGCRIGEALAVRWSDVDLEMKTISINGTVVSVKGKGVMRQDFTKTNEDRTLPLPSYAVAMLMARQVSADPNPHDVVFPSQVGTLRDPDGLSKQWRRVRMALGFDWVTTHTFRKTLATIIDDAGLSARVGADQLGHSHVSMTQDVYFGRNQTHKAVADALDKAFGAN